METYTDCELPELLEEAMQVIAVLRWPGRDADPDVKRAADLLMERLYRARREAMEAGCRCCQRELRALHSVRAAQQDNRCSEHYPARHQ